MVAPNPAPAGIFNGCIGAAQEATFALAAWAFDPYFSPVKFLSVEVGGVFGGKVANVGSAWGRDRLHGVSF